METRHKHAGSGEQLNERLAHSGLRLTPQRQRVHEVLLEKQDHPTADQVFFRAKSDLQDISMATVYNCLDALVQCGLVREVTLDRGATRYCPNMQDHSHFYCDACGRVYDIHQTISPADAQIKLPRGFRLKNIETNLHGLCPDCAAKAK